MFPPAACVLIAVVLSLAVPGAAGAGGVNLSLLHGYEEDATGRFLGFYNDSVNLSLSQDLTQAARLSENVRYGWQYREGKSSRKDFNPAARLMLRNDIFTSRFAASRRESRTGDNYPGISTSLQADIGSAWKNRIYPRLHVGVGTDHDYVDADPRTLDRQKDRINSSISWSYAGVGLYYDYSLTRDRDKVRNSDNDLVSHLARFNAGRSFWEDRLSLNLSHSYNLTINDNTNLAGASGVVLRRLVVSQALSGNDNTPLTGALAVNPGLNDGNSTAGAASMTLGQSLNIAARLDLQTVNRLYLYTTSDLGSLASSFNWRLYSSSDGVTWTQESLNTTSVTYDPANLRFEVPVGGVSATYVKVVVDFLLPSPQPSFSEVEAYATATAPPGSTVKDTIDITTNQTNFALGWQIMPDLRFGYNLGLYKKEYDPGRDSETRNQTASLNYSPNIYLDATLSAGDNWRKESGQLEVTSRTYGLSLGSVPIPTLDLRGGTTYTENRRGEVLISKVYHYDLDMTATLYPELSTTYNMSQDTTRTEATGSTSRTFKQTLAIAAGITPTLSSTLSGTQTVSRNDTAKTTGYEASLNFNWHPGDLLSMSLAGARKWDDSHIESQALNVTMNAKTSANTQLDLRYNLTKKEKTTQGGSASLRWNLLPWLRWQNLVTYSSSRENEFSLKSTMTASFSTY